MHGGLHASAARRLLGGLLTALLLLSNAAVRAEAHVLVVTGLGGEPYYAERFADWSRTLVDVAGQRLGVAGERVQWLAPAGVDGAHGESRLAAVRDAVQAAVAASRPGDVVLIALIGHGTARDQDVLFNLPGPDLSARELNALLAGFEQRTVVVANTSAASAPFVETLSAPGRIIITATSSARENEFTRFGGFFAEAFAADAADADKDGRVSVFEAFQHARASVQASFAGERLLQTEHALLDDDGDGAGSLEPGNEGSDGALARSVYLQAEAVPADLDDSQRLALAIEARRLVADIETLKRRKPSLREDEFRAGLEALLVQLALNRRAWRGEVQQP